MEFYVTNLDEKVYREDIPKVLRNDVGNQEVNFFAGVDTTGVASTGVNAISAVAHTGRSLDLDARETTGKVEVEIVAVAVAPRFGDAESEAGGLVEEGGFGDFSATLGREVEGWRLKVSFCGQ